MTDRGEYRPIYEALWSGKDFQLLTSDARLVLLALKGNCGACGIRAIAGRDGALVEWTGMPFERVSDALRMGVDHAWIEVEANVVWVVRGLEFEPTMNPENENHRKFVQRIVKALPRLEIVNRFCQRYAPYVKGLRMPFDSPSDGLRSTTTTTSPSTVTTKANGQSGNPTDEIVQTLAEKWSR